MLESQREPVPPHDGGELDTALAFLNFQRACVFKKIEGLDATVLPGHDIRVFDQKSYG